MRYRRARTAQGLLAAVTVEHGRITAVTPEDGTTPDRQDVDLDGALLLPAFVDAHVHVTETGLFLTGADLTGTRSATEILDRVAGSARGGPVLGHGWDDRTWTGPLPTAEQLDRAAGGAHVYLSRVDVHSALVSTALARDTGLTALDGWDGAGRVERDAHHAARRATRFALAPAHRRHLQETALAAAAAAGIGEVHEMAAPHIAPEEDLRSLLDLAGAGGSAHGPPGGGAGPAGGSGPRAAGERDRRGGGRGGRPVEGGAAGLPLVVASWGELATTAEEAAAIADRVLGGTGHRLSGLAGDLNVDGSIGSRTAALREDYADAPGHRGHRYLDAGQIGRHVAACTGAGLAAGFHAIGDAALDAVLDGFDLAVELLAARLGHERARAAVRAGGHRVEHAEALDAGGPARLARLGVAAGIQPSFDAAWGGPDGMYAQRLGRDRAARLNPFAALAAAGVDLALGSDSPVTPFAPWEGVRAAVRHRTAGSGLDARLAFTAHTAGRRVAAGQPARLAAWDAGNDLDAVLRALAEGAPAPSAIPLS